MTAPPVTSTPRTPDRIVVIDVVRGLALLGILLPNIVAFAMPTYAYADPTFYGGAQGANWWAWAITFVVADGKMRGLFTMLFGASTILIAERASAAGSSPAAVHYARMATLFAIGMVHAYLIWSGDILVSFAVYGALVFVAWRWDVSRLLAVAALLLTLQLADGVIDHAAARHFEARATAAEAAPALRDKWQDYQQTIVSLRDTIPEELAAFRGTWAEALPQRSELAWGSQTGVLPRIGPETLAMMLVGMALFRGGFFSGAWPRRWYRVTIYAGFGICLPLYGVLAWWISANGFDPITLLLTEPLHLVLLRPIAALAYASAMILLVQSGALTSFVARLAAAGRMAFSNYLGTSLVCTHLFCGYGLGWFGSLERWQLYPIVLVVWTAILLWSAPWLARFDHGPAEWSWRWCTRALVQTTRPARTPN